MQWTQDGTLVAAGELARHWGITPRNLASEAGKDRLLLPKIRGRRWAPRGYLDLAREDVARVSKALEGVPASSQLIFWLREHGGLGGLPPARAIRNGELETTLRIAISWAADQRLHTELALPSRQASN